MDFLLYEPEDFVSDESYLRYYFRLNEADIAFWQDWISKHPEKLDSVINADQLIGLLSLQLDESQLAHEYQRLMQAIEDNQVDDNPAIDHLTPPENTSYRRSGTFQNNIRAKKTRLFQKMWIVAAVALVSVTVYLYIAPLRKYSLPIGYTNNGGGSLWKKTNNGTEAVKFQLEDGSIITLQPGSSLTYPHNFLPSRREVFLDGEAFFEVSKNKKRPFYVYCQRLVAHVLGTSFNIKADKLRGKIEVDVRTGKVEVYQKYKDAIADQHKQNNGLILTPNQKAVYLEENNKFESSLVDVPLPIAYSGQENAKDSLPPENLGSSSILMSEILKSLEKTYGIEIEVENEHINNCHFRGDMSDMNLYYKLDAICQSLNLTYEVKGTRILLRGRGCN